MPNWKKVIISGSDASLSSLSLDGISDVSSSISDLDLASASFASRIDGISTEDVDVSAANLKSRLGEVTGNIILSSSARLILGTDTSTNAFHIHTDSSSSSVMAQFTNATTGDGSADGFELGIGATGNVMFWNNESSSIYFATDNITRGGFYPAGQAFFTENVSINSLSVAQHALEVNGTAQATTFTGSFSGDGSNITGLTYKENVSGNSSYTITHNLNDSYPFVQCWNTVNGEMEIPSSVSTSNSNTIVVDFGLPFTGRIIVRK